MLSRSVKNFYKSRLLVKFLKTTEKHLLQHVEFTFSIAYNPETEHPGPLNLSNSFGQNIFNVGIIHYLAAKIPGLSSVPLGEKLKIMKIVSFAVIYFDTFVSSISLERNVFRPSNFQLNCFKNSRRRYNWGINL